jgi:DNA-binding CsgD family transcriptional regulator
MDRLDAGDARRIVRILGKVCACEVGLAGKRRLLMEELCALLDADCWTWVAGMTLDPATPPTFTLLLHGGLDEARFARLMRAQEHPDMAWLTAPYSALLRERNTHVTRMRQQTDPGDRFRGSGAYALWLEADVAPGIMSFRPTGPCAMSGVTIHRRIAEPLFTEWELRIAHIVLTEVPWLHAKSAAGDSDGFQPALSPRRYTILNLLLDGQSRRAISEHLGISVHTVNEHVKGIYGHCRVHSQAELIHRFTSGDGGHA